MNKLSKVHILTLLYNSSRFLPDYFNSLEKLDYPKDMFEINLLDNGSADNCFQSAKDLSLKHKSLKVNFYQSDKNLGFSGGNNYLFKLLLAKNDVGFYLLLNPDSAIHFDCLTKLVFNMQADPNCAMLEAKQAPKEHPKFYDLKTFETSWCSGGGLLIRKSALEKVGIFDDRFFLYSEDVDLSWRMWLHGYSCKVAPEAVYEHFTQHVDQKRDNTVQQYYNFRNSFFMHWKYDSLSGILKHYILCIKTCFKQADQITKKRLLKAIINAQKDIPGLIVDRIKLKKYQKPKWIYFNNFDYEQRCEFKECDDGTRLVYRLNSPGSS